MWAGSPVSSASHFDQTAGSAKQIMSTSRLPPCWDEAHSHRHDNGPHHQQVCIEDRSFIHLGPQVFSLAHDVVVQGSPVLFQRVKEAPGSATDGVRTRVPPGEMIDSAPVTVWAGSRQRIWVGVLLVAALTASIVTVIHELWRVPLRVPLAYGGDANGYLTIVKGLANGHWYYTDDRLGHPFGMEMYDFPTADHLQILIYKAIGSVVGGDPALTVNLGYLAGYILIAVTAYLVLTTLGVRPIIAGAIGILYAFLPYHLTRGTNHLFLSGYFAVPLAVLVVLRQYDQPAFLMPDQTHSNRYRWSWRHGWGWLAVGFLIMIGTTGFYYAIFTGLFLIATLVFRLISERDRAAAASTLFLCTILGLTILADLAPTFSYQAANGVNEISVNRTYSDTELYALKPLQMLLPTHNHRVEVLRSPAIKALTTNTTGEGPHSLGLVAAVGLMMVVLRTLARIGVSTPREPHSRTLDKLGVLTIGAILGASVAGFAAGFGLLGLTYIRAWNRITVFVAFFTLAVVALVIDGWTRRSRIGLGAITTISALLVVVGVYDQTPPPSPALDQETAAAWENDRDFFQTVEADVGPNAAIYQLPHVQYPEGGGPHKMIDYDHIRGYLHTDTLSWSYGGVKGRVPEWQTRINTLDTTDKLRAIALMGFDGLYIDRYGYPDGAAALQTELEGATGTTPTISADNRLVFFNIEELANQIRSDTPAAERDGIITALEAPPIQVEYGTGFHGMEGDGTHSWSWATQQANLELSNPSERTRSIILSTELRTGHETPSRVTVRTPGQRVEVQVSNTTGCLRAELALPPGSTTVSFETDAPRVEATGGDPRDLHLQVLNLTADDPAWLSYLDAPQARSC
jgi:phosphoglycerol transferase